LKERAESSLLPPSEVFLIIQISSLLLLLLCGILRGLGGLVKGRNAISLLNSAERSYMLNNSGASEGGTRFQKGSIKGTLISVIRTLFLGILGAIPNWD
jgi:hypothetical protein